jgi:hypothetical protein
VNLGCAQTSALWAASGLLTLPCGIFRNGGGRSAAVGDQRATAVGDTRQWAIGTRHAIHEADNPSADNGDQVNLLLPAGTFGLYVLSGGKAP